MKTTLFIALCFVSFIGFSTPVMAAGPAIELPEQQWSFQGGTGTFDRAALQRGLQVYKQVCAACHSLNRVAYRNLSALGYNEAEIKAIAADAMIKDGPNDEGEMFERPGRPSDHFKAPFANDNAARYANGGALPPDLSLIVRARAGGADYIHALLTGYGTPPADIKMNAGMNYNKYFPGHQIAMAAPLVAGSVTYDDGTDASVEQMSKDVATFLAWASDPTMELRKQTGLKVMLFLFVFAGLMYATKRKIWKDVH
jgi:ubiquinol-cytochrome c reductase cytochrome c1 subunit